MTSFEQMGVSVCSLGACTPLGRNAAAAAAAVRAGISAHSEHAFMVDSEGELMRVAQCSWMSAEPLAEKRMAHFLCAAVAEAVDTLENMRVHGCHEGPLLFVNLPPDREGLPSGLVALIREALLRDFPGVFQHIEIYRGGRAGGFFGLKAALHSLTGGATAAIVAGADTFLQPETLEWLEETRQVHGAGSRNNAWGFVPGEGAGAVLLMTSQRAARSGLASLSRIVGLGLGRESELIRSGGVCLGKGLTAALRGTLTSLPEGKLVADIYCDMNGDPYRADEYGFAVLRLREHFVSASEFVTPADCWGDVGAASAPLGLLLATVAMQKRYATGPTLVWGSSDSGERGAALLVNGDAW